MPELGTSRPSFIQQLFDRKRTTPIEDEADSQLDAALERLSAATQENDETCARVRRRQESDKSFRIVTQPYESAE